MVVHSVRVIDPPEPAIPPDTLKEWLTAEGFTPVEWSKNRVFQRGQVPSMFGTEKEIEVGVGEEAG